MDYGGSKGTHLNPKPSPSEQKHVKFILGSANQDSSEALSSSSSSCGSSSDDFFLVNPQLLAKLGAQHKPPHPSRPAKPFYEDDEIDTSNMGSPQPPSRFSDITQDSLVSLQFLPTQSPPAQIMLRPTGFDPDRIPPSAFSKSSTPTEWSAASNDSLFSIRIGGTSFSRDPVCRVEPESTEQGGLLHSPKRSGEIIGFGSYSQDPKCIEPCVDVEKTVDKDVRIEGVHVMVEPKQSGPKVSVSNEVNNVKREPTGCSYGPHQLPEKSQVRVEYFIKPIKNKSPSFRICHCCGCKWLSCSFCCSFKWCLNFFKWPSCHCKCSNFWSSCCKCSSCFCCHCSSWSGCNCSSWSCCNWSSCSCFKCSPWSCCNCSSCSCFKCCNCSSCLCLKCSSWSCCNCSSCSCFKCSSWSCCNCRCWNCTWACCYCQKCEPKTSSCDSTAIFSDTTCKRSTKPMKRSKWSGFSCSCCCCWSCSFCC